MKKLPDDYFILNSGKTISSNRYIIGINPELAIYEGYDGKIPEEGMEIEEKIELADYMINLWNEFKEKASNDRKTE